jgi:hypothetical protein
VRCNINYSRIEVLKSARYDECHGATMDVERAGEVMELLTDEDVAQGEKKRTNLQEVNINSV